MSDPNVLMIAEKYAPEVVYLALVESLARAEKAEAALRKIANADTSSRDISCRAFVVMVHTIAREALQ